MKQHLTLIFAFFAMTAMANLADAGHCGGCYGCAPVACAPTDVEKVVYEPQWVTETRMVNVTKYKTEQRERTYTVQKCVPVTEQVEQSYTVMVPETRTKTVNYTVRVPK